MGQRAITKFFCSAHAREWIEHEGRIYGAPCQDREACKASGAATPCHYMVTEEKPGRWSATCRAPDDTRVPGEFG